MPESILLVIRALMPLEWRMLPKVVNVPVPEALGLRDDFGRRGFMVKSTPTNLPKFLPYHQRLFTGDRNFPLLARFQWWSVHDLTPHSGWRESEDLITNRDDDYRGKGEGQLGTVSRIYCEAITCSVYRERSILGTDIEGREEGPAMNSEKMRNACGMWIVSHYWYCEMALDSIFGVGRCRSMLVNFQLSRVKEG